ncbi:sulfur relay protein DsrC [bacterium SM23_57]|jgi:TusE/DsrC/DsvC family sulfur relay protein|nr:MAG: sulfur relay protein DsrC [bacterium SM23_57]
MSVLGTIERNQEGFLVNPNDWNKDIAAAIAVEEGVGNLTADHWKIIEFCRESAVNSGVAPTLRQITKGAGVPTKELFTLFPKGPAKKVAKISGLGKPEGCV